MKTRIYERFQVQYICLQLVYKIQTTGIMYIIKW